MAVSFSKILHCSTVTPLVNNSACTSPQGCLSSLSMDEQIVLNMSKEQPASSTIASNTFLWLTLTKNPSTPTASRISCMIESTQASGIIISYLPAMSKSHWQNSRYRPLAIVGWSLQQTLPMWNLFIFWMLVLLAIKRAKGTVKSYLREQSYPPWSTRSQINLESSPYLPVSTSLSQNTGVSISTPPCFLKTSTIVSMTLRRIAIWSGQKSLVPLGGFTQNFIQFLAYSYFPFTFAFYFSFCTKLRLYLFLSSRDIQSFALPF